MTLQPHERRPIIDGQAALEKSKHNRIRAAEIAVDTTKRPALFVEANGEEVAFDDTLSSSFTKGLPHDENGNADVEAYEMFVRALRKPHEHANQGGFPAPLGVENAKDKCWPAGYAPAKSKVKHHFYANTAAKPDMEDTRRWESPLGGINDVIEGPAPAGTDMAPAPRMGASELCAEMAEVYALALVRDVPFEDLHKPDTDVKAPGLSDVKIRDIFKELNNLSWFNSSKHPVSSEVDANGQFKTTLAPYEQARRKSRWNKDEEFTIQNMFRGSTPGAKAGPHLSQFMLQGTKGEEDGKIGFGTQTISQKNLVFAEEVNYMTDWHEWLDVQNGANFKNIGGDTKISERFLTTPRDLASYVQLDQLYQAYFNAALILLGNGLSLDHGLPNSNKGKTLKTTREGFATWGGPHLLALFAEVSSRGLKAVRRQKFQIHRRARPEVLAARLAIAHSGNGKLLGKAEPFVQKMLDELKRDCPNLLKWIDAVNSANREPVARQLERTDAKLTGSPIKKGKNLLLPMAFPEGSPMHPAYGAGHATVAGACITVLKAMFQMFGTGTELVKLSDAGFTNLVVGNKATLKDLNGSGNAASDLSVQGELDKLAANISIGRNMAGVHYYTDYYDSLRLGERIAIGILEEQMMTTPEKVCMSFNGFDGNMITIFGKPSQHANHPNDVGVTVVGFADPADWWKSHLPAPPTV